MASTQDYLTYVQELLREVSNITVKRMMGEYILYKDGVIFGGIYDNRFLVKKTPSLATHGFKEEIPYPSAKPMYLIDIENPREIAEMIDALYLDLIAKQ